MNQRQKTNLIRIITATLLMVLLAYLPLSGTTRFFAYLVPYLIVGYDILIKAGKGIWRRQPFDECLLMAVATIGAMALAVYEDGDYTEASPSCCFIRSANGSSPMPSGAAAAIFPTSWISDQIMQTSCSRRYNEKVRPDDVSIGSVILSSRAKKCQSMA